MAHEYSKLATNSTTTTVEPVTADAATSDSGVDTKRKTKKDAW